MSQPIKLDTLLKENGICAPTRGRLEFNRSYIRRLLRYNQDRATLGKLIEELNSACNSVCMDRRPLDTPDSQKKTLHFLRTNYGVQSLPSFLNEPPLDDYSPHIPPFSTLEEGMDAVRSAIGAAQEILKTQHYLFWVGSLRKQWILDQILGNMPENCTGIILKNTTYTPEHSENVKSFYSDCQHLQPEGKVPQIVYCTLWNYIKWIAFHPAAVERLSFEQLDINPDKYSVEYLTGKQFS